MTNSLLGVLGGMGPLASAHFMTRLTLLTTACRDQEHVPAVLWSDPRIPERGAAMQGGIDPMPWFAHAIDSLQAVGCGAIAIPCNTAHAWFDRMQAHAKVPILHIADAAAAELAKLVPKGAKVGVLANTTTIGLRLYQDKLTALGWQPLEPTQDELDTLLMPAINLVKANRVAESFAPVARAIAAIAARGAQAVILGCTELPLAVQAGDASRLPIPQIDTIDALALAAIAWSRGASQS